MRKLYLITTAILLVLVLGACGAGTKTSKEVVKNEVKKEVETKKPEVQKEKLHINLVESKYEGHNIIVRGNTNISDGVKLKLSLGGEKNEDTAIPPGFGVIENGEFIITLGDGTPVFNGKYPIEASFGSYGNEKVKEIYGSYDNFKEKYSIDGKIEKSPNDYYVNVKIGEIEITEGITEEELEQQRLEAKKQEAENIGFAYLNKNPEQYRDKYLTYKGEIVQIQEDLNSTVIRLAVTPSSYGYDYNDIVLVTYEGNTDFIDGDIVTIYGTGLGSHTYESTAGWNITVPLIAADIIE